MFFAATLSVNAQQQAYLQNFTSSININSGASGDYLGKAGYSIPSGSNFWTLQQWNNPTNLLPQAFSYGYPWELSNANSRIKFHPYLDGKVNVYELALANSPCNMAGYPSEADEIDLFLQPAAPFVSQKTTGEMGELNLKLYFSIKYQAVQHGCVFNTGSYIASLVLVTTQNIQPQQVLFIQINLGGTRAPINTPSWCPDYENVTNTLYINRFCVDDSIQHYGGYYLSSIGSQSYNLDVLPRIIQILQSDHNKPSPYQNITLHNNPNHWIISDFYIGSTNYGQTITTTTWANPQLNARGGTFCSNAKKVQYICHATPAGNNWVNAGDGCYHRQTGIPC